MESEEAAEMNMVPQDDDLIQDVPESGNYHESEVIDEFEGVEDIGQMLRQVRNVAVQEEDSDSDDDYVT